MHRESEVIETGGIADKDAEEKSAQTSEIEVLRKRVEAWLPRIKSYLDLLSEALTYNPEAVDEFIEETTAGKPRMMVRTNFAGGILLQLQALSAERLFRQDEPIEELHAFINYLGILGHQRAEILDQSTEENWPVERKEFELKKLGRKQLEEVKVRLRSIVVYLEAYKNLYESWLADNPK